MNRLQERYQKLFAETDTRFHRYMYDRVDWGARMIGLTGPRGVGKTTLVLQHIKEKQPRDTSSMSRPKISILPTIGYSIWRTISSNRELSRQKVSACMRCGILPRETFGHCRQRQPAERFYRRGLPFYLLVAGRYASSL